MAKAARNTTKTNAARLLEHAGISFELIPYTVDESNLAADHVAEELGEDIRRVFKTLVLEGTGGAGGTSQGGGGQKAS